jgi:hypothetical protein
MFVPLPHFVSFNHSKKWYVKGANDEEETPVDRFNQTPWCLLIQFSRIGTVTYFQPELFP